MDSSDSKLRYGLDDSLPPGELILHSFQHLAYFLANTAILPVVVGSYLGLTPPELASLLQRTFILCGVVSILQAIWGHRFAVMEGPAGLWYGVLIMLATSAESMGKSLPVLRTDIEMGFIVAGVVCVVLGLTGMVSRVLALFSPLVNGVFFALMALQLSPNIVSGMFGLSSNGGVVSWKSFTVFSVTTGLILLINIKSKGFMQSISILIGAGCGWVLAFVLGIAPQMNSHVGALSVVPEIFAWGAPTFDLGILVTFIFAAIILFSNLIATVKGMSAVTGEKVYSRTYDRAALMTGVSDILAGLGAVIGFIPYGSAIGMTLMTGVAARRPFIIGSSLLIILGIIPPVCAFFVAIPATVGTSVMFVVFCLILSLGIKEFNKVNMGTREMYVIGMSLLIGVGMMQMPHDAFVMIPGVVRNLLTNGLVVGVLMAMIFENLLTRSQS
ncbi:MAG: purine/pyrimidine permease [Desulfuromusa sp.]|nr:purine/pyrimidine permease [Desulfuromusa sp.]